MRSISVMRQEVLKLQSNIQVLRDEIADFQKKCPHPSDFLTRTVKSYDYDDYGTGSYDYSTVTYDCALCEGSLQGKWNKYRENEPFKDTLVLKTG